MSELEMFQDLKLENVMNDFALKQTAGAKLESAVLRNNLQDVAGRMFEWMSTGNNMAEVAKLASGEYELQPVKRIEFSYDSLVAIDQSLSKEDLKNFFTTRKGFFVDDAFRTLVEGAPSSDVPRHLELSKYDIKKEVSYRYLRQVLPKDHIFNFYDFCCMLATELAKQLRGEEGLFPIDGRTDVCFVGIGASVIAVSVEFWCKADWTMKMGSNVFDSSWKPGVCIISPS